MHPPGHERTSKDSLDANCSDLFFFTFPFLNLCFTDSQKNLAKKKKKKKNLKAPKLVPLAVDL